MLRNGMVTLSVVVAVTLLSSNRVHAQTSLPFYYCPIDVGPVAPNAWEGFKPPWPVVNDVQFGKTPRDSIDIVGYYYKDFDTGDVSWRWSDGTYVEFAAFGECHGYFSGGTQVWGLNDDGVLVGESCKSETLGWRYHAFRVAPTLLGADDLGAPDAPLGCAGSSNAYAVSNTGTIVGDYSVQGGCETSYQGAVWWSGVMPPEVVGPVGGNQVWTAFLGVNDVDEVVGLRRSLENSPARAFFYSHAGGFDLPDFGLGGEAYAVNNAHHAVGYCLGNDTDHAVRWEPTPNGFAVVDLGPQGIGGRALDINERDEAVGFVFSNTGNRACLWSEGQLTYIDEIVPPGTGWVFEQATSINNAGDIVGIGQHNGQARAFLIPRADSDGDGLLDIWETHGIDIDCDGVIDLHIEAPPFNADPEWKDLYVDIGKDVDVELQALAEPVSDLAAVGIQPTGTSLDLVSDAFLRVPAAVAKNPNGRDGIRLHLRLVDYLIAVSPSYPSYTALWAEWDNNILPQFGGADDAVPARRARALAFRDCVFVRNPFTVEGRVIGGCGELFGDAFFVAKSRLPAVGPIQERIRGRDDAIGFMHELGHTLGLDHGGDVSVNYKPNYRSVMNYSWAHVTKTYNAHGFLDFSYGSLTRFPLSEEFLDERAGIHGPAGVFVPAGPCVKFGGTEKVNRTVEMSGEVDWNRNDFIDDMPVRVTVNQPEDDPLGFGDCLSNRCESDVVNCHILWDYDDWTNLRYLAFGVGNFVEGQHMAHSGSDGGDLPDEVMESLENFCNEKGDLNCDTRIDSADRQRFVECWSGAGVGPVGVDCILADFDNDGDVDCADWSSFVTVWTGGGTPPSIPQCPGASPLDPKNRFISFSVDAGSQPAAIRVTLVSLHNVVPPYTGGASVPFTPFEGQSMYVGPPVQYVESASSGATFYAAQLQCAPHYQDWSTVGLLHVTGEAIVPSSTYNVENLAASCAANESTCTAVSTALEIKTTRWGDVETPYYDPAQPEVSQPDTSDISSLVNKFKSAMGAPIKARALLAGGNARGTIGPVEISPDFNFTHISMCVDAFKGMPYPYKPGKCAGDAAKAHLQHFEIVSLGK